MTRIAPLAQSTFRIGSWLRMAVSHGRGTQQTKRHAEYEWNLNATGDTLTERRTS